MNKFVRPISLKSHTSRIETGCGHIYITVCYEGNYGSLPVEVFAHLGKAGGCVMVQLEAITRAVTLGLKHGVPVEEFVRQFRGIRCPAPAWDGGVLIQSCADAIGRVLETS